MICTRCQMDKEENDFNISTARTARNGRNSWCKDCLKEVNQTTRKRRTPEQERNRQLQRMYGLTLEQYKQMCLDRNYKCDICERACLNLHVDHCHNTLKVRGLLCADCNSALGLLRDDPLILARALEYLKKDRGPLDIYDLLSRGFAES